MGWTPLTDTTQVTNGRVRLSPQFVSMMEFDTKLRLAQSRKPAQVTDLYFLGCRTLACFIAANDV